MAKEEVTPNLFIVNKYPYDGHPDEQRRVVGEAVDLSHLSPAEIQRMLDRRLMLAPEDYTPPADESEEPEEPAVKLNSKGFPHGEAKPAGKKPKETPAETPEPIKEN
jgi:hypothetical protein